MAVGVDARGRPPDMATAFETGVAAAVGAGAGDDGDDGDDGGTTS